MIHFLHDEKQAITILKLCLSIKFHSINKNTHNYHLISTFQLTNVNFSKQKQISHILIGKIYCKCIYTETNSDKQ